MSVSHPKFIVVTVHVGQNDSELNKVSDVLVRTDFIRQVSKIEQQDPEAKIKLLTPVVGMCALTMIDGSNLVCKHTFEEMSAFLEASRVATVH